MTAATDIDDTLAAELREFASRVDVWRTVGVVCEYGVMVADGHPTLRVTLGDDWRERDMTETGLSDRVKAAARMLAQLETTRRDRMFATMGTTRTRRGPYNRR